MGRHSVILKAILVLALVWGAVWGVRAWAGGRKVTAERVDQTIARADFADWSSPGASMDPDEEARRKKQIRELAGLVNRLDFKEREKSRENRSAEDFFRKMSRGEKELFIDLTVAESMNRFMEALDSLPPEERKKFVERGLEEIRDGRTGAEMARAEELGDDLLNRVSAEGMRAYFEKSSADTKLDLAPLMEAMNEVMQGLRGNELPFMK